MISRRQYFSILLVFLAVFLLFQGTQIGRQYWNPYLRGLEEPDTGLRMGDLRWAKAGGEADGETDGEAPGEGDPLRVRVFYAGSRDTDLARVAEEWADYARLPLTFALPEAGEADTLVLVETLPEDTGVLEALLAEGADILLLTPPDAERIREDESLRALLGIREVRTDHAPLRGVHLFSGFLLGGERIYAVQAPGEEDRLDLVPDCPWYVLGPGTKTYMQGVLEDSAAAPDLKNEEKPALFWRCGSLGGSVFTAAFPLFGDRQVGMGLLSAVMAQRGSCAMYPVVNAQLTSLLNYPETADENGDVLATVYGRQQTDLEKNIILPMLSAEVSESGMALTCFLAPQYDYTDDCLPARGLLQEVLEEMGELRGELGLSLLRRGNTALADKLAADRAALEELEAFTCTSACAQGGELEGLAEHLHDAPLEHVRTVFTWDRPDLPLLSFMEDNVTLQQFTANQKTHTFLEDLRLLCLETALGYSSGWFDMASVLWPEAEEEEWQFASQTLFSNLSSYSAPFRGFSQVTATAADTRVRRFLCLSWDARREGNTILGRVEGFQEEAYFLLRLFGEEIAWGREADWVELEPGTWLVTARSADFQLELRPSELPVQR